MSDHARQPGEPGATKTSRGRAIATGRDGAIAGLLGAAAIAVFFFVLDLARGQPLATPSLLGSALFLGLEPEAAAAGVRPDMVAAYSVLHIAAFLVFGWIFAWGVDQIDRRPVAGIFVVFAFVCFEAAFVSFSAALMPGVLGALGTGAVLAANAIAALCMGVYLLRWRAPHALRGIDRLSAERAGQPVQDGRGPGPGRRGDPAKSSARAKLPSS